MPTNHDTKLFHEALKGRDPRKMSLREISEALRAAQALKLPTRAEAEEPAASKALLTMRCEYEYEEGACKKKAVASHLKSELTLCRAHYRDIA